MNPRNWLALREEQKSSLREKLFELLTEFFLEAAVLVAVLGVLERLIADAADHVQENRIGYAQASTSNHAGGLWWWMFLCVGFGMILFCIAFGVQIWKHKTSRAIDLNASDGI